MRGLANADAISLPALIAQLACLLASLGLAAASPTGAADDDPYASANAGGASSESWGYALAHELMSPYCPGRTLAACTSGQAAELRQWIVLQEAAGASREEVLAILYERFGDVIRSTPRPQGWGLAARALPAAALVLGAGMVFFVLRRMVARGGSQSTDTARAPSSAPRSGYDAELERQIEEELRASDA